MFHNLCIKKLFKKILLYDSSTSRSTHTLTLPHTHTNLTVVGGSAILRLLVGRHTALHLREAKWTPGVSVVFYMSECLHTHTRTAAVNSQSHSQGKATTLLVALVHLYLDVSQQSKNLKMSYVREDAQRFSRATGWSWETSCCVSRGHDVFSLYLVRR